MTHVLCHTFASHFMMNTGNEYREYFNVAADSPTQQFSYVA